MPQTLDPPSRSTHPGTGTPVVERLSTGTVRDAYVLDFAG